MKVLAIASTNVRRMLRERSNIFFVFILPLAIILLIGAQFGGDVDPVVGVFREDDGRLASMIATEIEAEEQIDTVAYETSDELTAAVERGNAQAGVFLPAGLDDAAKAGVVVEVGFMARPDGFGVQLRSVVGSAVSRVMTPVAAAQFAATQVGAVFDEALITASDLKSVAPGIAVESSAVGEALFPETLGRFDLGAAQQLVLFVFLTALAGSAALILTRQLGVSRRMLATPTSVRTIVFGEGAGRWGTAMVQGLYVVVATLLLFRVNWGDPWGALLILVTFSAVGAGAGLLMGATFSNDQQAGGVGVVLSLGLAALGGSMLPSEFFSPTLQRISHLTPHAWALDGFAELVRRNGGVGDILVELGVLALYAAVLFLLAAWRLRTVITRP
jgi:ABC-2 type transport system permease protein